VRFSQRTHLPTDVSVRKEDPEETITTAVLRTETVAETVVPSRETQRRAINNVDA
jgi:hypothetical protein